MPTKNCLSPRHKSFLDDFTDASSWRFGEQTKTPSHTPHVHRVLPYRSSFISINLSAIVESR